MLNIFVNDETALLKTVILGTAESFGNTPDVSEAYDPKSRENIINGTYPVESELSLELDGFKKVLEKHGVKVYRPETVENCNQVFARDIGFVIEDKFVLPRILKNRRRESEGIEYIVDQISENNILEVPEGVRMEGGDVMPWHDHIFVGYSRKEDFKKFQVSRTNEQGVAFLKSKFPDKTVVPVELKKSDSDPRENALHLDCCFQPVGKGMAIIYKGGFKNESDYNYFIDFFGAKNTFEITREEMYQMNSNIFSISPEVVVSEKDFTRLNSWLRDKDILVEEIKFSETSRMEGLLRCTTLPLLREK